MGEMTRSPATAGHSLSPYRAAAFFFPLSGLPSKGYREDARFPWSRVDPNGRNLEMCAHARSSKVFVGGCAGHTAAAGRRCKADATDESKTKTFLCILNFQRQKGL